MSRRPALPSPMEAEVLAALKAWCVFEHGQWQYGWHINENLLCAPRYSLDQVRDALGRLRKKGLVEAVRWHAGQGNGAALEWLWFPTEEPVAEATRPPD